MDDHARLRALLNTAVDGIISIDERGIIQAANPAAEELFGYSAAEIIGRNVSVLMPSPHADQHDQYLSNYVRTGVRKIIGIGREVEGRRKDGSTFPLYLSVSEVSFDHRRLFTGFVHDLTDLKKAEEQATQLGRILEDSLNEIFIFDAHSLQFLLVNRGALTNLGYTAEEMALKSPPEIKPELTEEQFRQLIAPLVSNEESVLQFETVHERRDGSRYYIHAKLQKAVWQDREAIVAIILDVTEQKRAQKELAQLNAELEQRVEQRTRELTAAQEQLVRREKLVALGQLSGGVAHEIRNPLGVIRNSVYYLKMISDQLDEDGQECISEIDREVTTANRIVSELLDFTRDTPSQAERVSLQRVIADSVRASEVPDTVQLQVQSIEPDVEIWADRIQVERVLINLIRNACQAMSGTGQLSITSTATAEFVTIDVQDFGIGIPPEQLENVFEPLFTTKAKGIGLGLAVSRRYAQRNGGSLTFDSAVGKGTTFHFCVPLAKASDE